MFSLEQKFVSVAIYAIQGGHLVAELPPLRAIRNQRLKQQTERRT